MEGTLADRLHAARARAFVGRRAELELFDAMLSGRAGFHVLWLSGPGGIGKSSLLERLAADAAGAGLTVARLDAATVPATPAAVGAALTGRLAEVPEGGRAAVLVDEVDAWAPVHDWLRTHGLPELPARHLVVLASRHRPGPPWRTDPGWAAELRCVQLGALASDEVADYAERRGTPAGLLPEVLAQSQGHPLAMALVTDLLLSREPGAAGSGLGPADRHHVVEVLLERFIDSVPHGDQRRALNVFGLARCTTLPLLRAAVDPETADACFTWLAGLSFAQLSQGGISPHELARTVLEEDLRWRDPEAWGQLRASIRADARRRLLVTTEAAQRQAATDLLWFHRRTPMLAPHWSAAAGDGGWADRAREEDLPAICELVAEHEGPTSVELHRRWWRVQPDAFLVVRTEAEPVRGFLVHLLLDAEALAAPPAVDDPVLAAALALLAARTRVRPFEHCRVIRSWMGSDGYHLPTETNRVLTAAVASQILTEPRLAVTVAYAVGEQLWTALYGYADYARAPDGDATLGARRYVAFLHDWRITPALEWLDLMESRLGTGGTVGVGAEQAREHAARHVRAGADEVLSAEQFAGAVRQAFRDAADPLSLGSNPLLASPALRPLVTADPSASPTAADLRALLADQVAALSLRPRRQTAARALELTYLSGVRTQEAVAMRMGLPFSTYRRHLSTGLADVVAQLWRQELGGS